MYGECAWSLGATHGFPNWKRFDRELEKELVKCGRVTNGECNHA
jgi:hypothetical protein